MWWKAEVAEENQAFQCRFRLLGDFHYRRARPLSRARIETTFKQPS